MKADKEKKSSSLFLYFPNHKFSLLSYLICHSIFTVIAKSSIWSISPLTLDFFKHVFFLFTYLRRLPNASIYFFTPLDFLPYILKYSILHISQVLPLHICRTCIRISSSFLTILYFFLILKKNEVEKRRLWESKKKNNNKREI